MCAKYASLPASWAASSISITIAARHSGSDADLVRSPAPTAYSPLKFAHRRIRGVDFTLGGTAHLILDLMADRP